MRPSKSEVKRMSAQLPGWIKEAQEKLDMLIAFKDSSIRGLAYDPDDYDNTYQRAIDEARAKLDRLLKRQSELRPYE